VPKAEFGTTDEFNFVTVTLAPLSLACAAAGTRSSAADTTEQLPRAKKHVSSNDFIRGPKKMGPLLRPSLGLFRVLYWRRSAVRAVLAAKAIAAIEQRGGKASCPNAV